MLILQKKKGSLFSRGPIDNVKFYFMLKGLSVSEISLSEVLKSGIMRIESEFYNSEKMVYHHCKKGKDIIVFSQYGTSKDLNEESLGYPVLRLNEYNQSFISAI